MKKRITILILAILPVFGCNLSKNPKLKFLFHINETEGFVPSNQIAIWLEKPGGEYVKTFFVCDYLSYGGFNIPDICPNWVGKSNWKDAPKELVDAVAQATPHGGDILLEFDCPKDEVPNGKYRYCIEINIAENYNELYTGNITISDSVEHSVISDVVVTFQPERYSKASNLLSKVKVGYNN